MSNIYTQIKNLTTDPKIHAIIDIIDGGKWDDPAERRRTAESAWKMIMPAIPPGQRYVRGSFWEQANSKMIWRGMIGVDSERRAKWLHSQRNANKVPMFQPDWNAPQPRQMGLRAEF